MKQILHLSLISAIIAISVTTAYLEKDSDVRTDTFCAYGKVFVTFKHQNHFWGTIMLDDRGAPIPCSDNDDVKEIAKFKGII